MPTLEVTTVAALPPAGTVVRLIADGNMWSGKAVKILNYPDPFTVNIEAVWGNHNRTLVRVERLSDTIVRNHPQEVKMPPAQDPAARFEKMTFSPYQPNVKNKPAPHAPAVRFSTQRLSLNKAAVELCTATFGGTPARVLLSWNHDQGILCIRPAHPDHVALAVTQGKGAATGGAYISLTGFYNQFDITPPAKATKATPHAYGTAIYIEVLKAFRGEDQ